jgi:hypothetical protein
MADHVFRSGIVAPAEGRKRRAVQTPKQMAEEAILNDEDGNKAGLSYIERMAAQRKIWKEQDEARFYNPDLHLGDEGTWNVYVWMTRRRKKMTQNRLFAGIRQSLKIPKDRPVKLISDRDDAARKKRNEVWEHIPPKHHDTLAPWSPPKEALALRALPKQTKTKIRKDTSPKVEGSPKVASTGRVVGFTFKTRYVAWGKRGTGPWTYLGPCLEQKKTSAKKEIRDRFPIYADPVIVAVKDLKYSMRNRLRDGRIVPGSTKINPPETH